MSFLSKALTVVGAIVGIAAAVASGGTLGLIAGAFIAVGAAANLGLIGGSVGKFMNSGLGRGLLAATTLGSAAVAMYGATATEAGVQAATQTGQEEMSQTVGNTIANDSTAIGTDVAQTNQSFLESTQLTQQVGQAAADPTLSTVPGVSTEAVKTAGAQYAGTAQNASAEQASMGATQGDTQALVGKGPVDPAVSHGFASNDPAYGAGAQSGAGTPAANPNDLTGVTPPGADQYKDIPPAGSPPAAAGSAAGTPGGGVGGFLNAAMNSKGGAAMIQGAGSLLGGIGNGIAQKQAVQDQLAAANWGNNQWANKGQVAQMQAAAAKPVTVPQGYLERANQVKTLMSGSQGIQPLPVAQPGAPLAPSPVHG
jgi:hypothetical protein